MINSCKTKRPEDKYNKQSLVRRPETSESTISILSYKPLCQGLSRTPTSGKTLPITSLPVKKNHSKSVPAGEMCIPTKINSNFISPSYKIGSPVKIRQNV